MNIILVVVSLYLTSQVELLIIPAVSPAMNGFHPECHVHPKEHSQHVAFGRKYPLAEQNLSTPHTQGQLSRIFNIIAGKHFVLRTYCTF